MRLRLRVLAALYAGVLTLGLTGIAQAQEAPRPATGVPAPKAAPAPAAGAAAGSKADDDNGWNFDDEDEEKTAREQTLGEIVRPQLPDIAAFTGLLVLCLISFFKKSDALKIATLVYTLVFLGFLRSQLYSVVNIFGLITMNLPIFSNAIFTYMFWAATLGTTVIWGRLYCGRVCAYGAFTQLMDLVVPKKLRYTVPVKIEQKAAYIKFGLLAFVLVYYFITKDVYIYRYTEPFWMFSRQGSVLMWSLLGVLLVATIFVRNLYCRFLCPVGAFLAVISQVTTIFRIKRWAECKTCKICEKTCEWGAIRGPQIVRSECVRCDDCERLYHDQQRCVHHIVIRRKADVLAKQAATQAALQASQSV